MPLARIPVTRFRELQMGATERDFLHHFAEPLRWRGFRFVPGRWVRCDEEFIGVPDTKGRFLVADPPLTLTRHADASPPFLEVRQDVPGRVPDAMLRGLAMRLAALDTSALAELHGYLLAEGDDRAGLIAELLAEWQGADGGAAIFEDDNASDDAPLITAATLMGRRVCRKAAVLFGAREEAL